MSIQPKPEWGTPVLDPKTEGDAIANLEHTLQIYGDEPDGRLIVLATSNVYGDRVRTGLTWGDLRLIARRLGCAQ